MLLFWQNVYVLFIVNSWVEQVCPLMWWWCGGLISMNGKSCFRSRFPSALMWTTRTCGTRPDPLEYSKGRWLSVSWTKAVGFSQKAVCDCILSAWPNSISYGVLLPADLFLFCFSLPRWDKWHISSLGWSIKLFILLVTYIGNTQTEICLCCHDNNLFWCHSPQTAVNSGSLAEQH